MIAMDQWPLSEYAHTRSMIATDHTYVGMYGSIRSWMVNGYSPTPTLVQTTEEPLMIRDD